MINKRIITFTSVLAFLMGSLMAQGQNQYGARYWRRMGETLL